MGESNVQFIWEKIGSFSGVDFGLLANDNDSPSEFVSYLQKGDPLDINNVGLVVDCYSSNNWMRWISAMF